jgi:hypothetical protein
VDSVVANEKNGNLKTLASGGGTDGSVCIAFKWYKFADTKASQIFFTVLIKFRLTVQHN